MVHRVVPRSHPRRLRLIVSPRALKPLPTSPLLALALAFGMVSHDDALARHVACRATDVMRVGSCY